MTRGGGSWQRASVALVAVAAAACSDQLPTDPVARSTDGARLAVETTDQAVRHLILTVAGPLPDDFETRLLDAGISVLAVYPEIGVVNTQGMSPALVEAVRAWPDVEAVTPDGPTDWLAPFVGTGASAAATAALSSPLAPGSTPQGGASLYTLGKQWNLTRVGADEAWSVANGGRRTVVAILDTGVDTSHPDLAGKIGRRSRSFVDETLEDLNGHGTFVAGIISTHGAQAASVAPEAELLALKVLPGLVGDTEPIIAGIMYAARGRVDVINMSLGAPKDRNDPVVDALARAVAFAQRRGVLVVAATGNEGVDLDADDPATIYVPAELPGVVGVGATDPNDQVPGYANFGASVVDLVAPGGSDGAEADDWIWSTWSSHSTSFDCYDPTGTGDLCVQAFYGTSFAAPHVSAAAAVLQSTSAGRMRWQQLSQCLYESAEDLGAAGMDALTGHGRLDLLAALTCDTRGPSLSEEEGASSGRAY